MVTSPRGLMGRRQAARGAVADERGAVLILALFFLVIVSLLVTTLLTYTGGGLTATNRLRSIRTTEYAAEGAAELAVQTVRYSSSEYLALALCSPGPSNVVTIGTTSMIVTCVGTYNYYSPTGATRTITFTACPSSEATASCTSSSTGTLAPVVTAQVVFDDWSSTDVNQCSGPTTTTCGTGMTIENWVVA